jgi:hypothetical protein
MKSETNVRDISTARIPALAQAPAHVDADVVSCLRALLEQAEAGALHGLVFAAMCSGQLVISDLAGEAERSLIFARGLAAVLDDTIRDAMYRPHPRRRT